MLPGTRLLRLARAWFDDATVVRVFEPLVADWQREVATATTAGQRTRLSAHWYLAFALTLSLSAARTFFVRPPARAALGFAAGVLGATGVGVVVMIMFVAPYLSKLGAPPLMLTAAVAGSVAWLCMVLMPLGALPASMLARHAGASRGDVTRLGGLLLIAVVVIVGWIGPLGERTRSLINEELLLPPWVARGMTEAEARQWLRASRIRSSDLQMSVPELLRARVSGAPAPLRSERVTAELHRRVALVGLTILMAVAGWRLAARRPRHVVLSVITWSAGTAGLLLGCWFIAVRAAAFGPLAGWMTSWVTLAVAMGLTWLSTRDRSQAARNSAAPAST